MTQLRKPKGKSGDWFAKLGDEKVPCVHKHWLRRLYYHDPFLDGGTKQTYDFVNAIRTGLRVIVTNDIVHFGSDPSRPIGFDRDNYIAVYRIEDFYWSEPHLKFRLAEKIEPLA